MATRQPFSKSRYGAASLLAAAFVGFASQVPGQAPLDDPLPERVVKGKLVVAAIPFVRAPQTEDPAKPGATNDAYARIQYLLPVPGGAGRLAFNDIAASST